MNNTSSRSLFTGSRNYYINVAIMLVLMIFFRFIPAFGSMTEMGMAVLGVFIGTIYGWMTLKDMSLASAAGIVMMGTTGFYATPAASISAAFGHNQFISVAGCFALIAVMQHSGLIEYLVKAIVRWKVARNSIPALLFIVTIFSHIFGFFGNFGMYALIWTLWKGIVEEIRGDKKLLEFGIAITSIGFVLCACAWQFTPPSLVVEGLFASVTGLPNASTFAFFFWMLLAVIFLTALFLLAGKFIFKVNFPKTTDLKVEKSEKMDAYKAVTLILFVIYLLILIISNTVDIGFIDFLGGFNIAGLGIAALIICMIVLPKGCNFPRLGDAMNSGIQWTLLLNMGIVGLFTGALGSADVGITATISNACGFMADLPPVVFVLVVIIVPCFLTQFFNNLALCTVFIPVACSLAMEAGLNATAIYYAMFISCNTALATPSGSANAAFMFSWSDIDRKSCFKYGWTIFGITVVVSVLMYFILGNLFFPA